MLTLAQKFLSEVQSQAGVAPFMGITLKVPEIQSVLDFIESEPTAGKLRDEIVAIFRKRNWMLDPIDIQQFMQLIGEAQFWTLAKRAGVELERISEGGGKSPDFRLRGDSEFAPYFEVKTLSVKGGDTGIATMNEDSFQAEHSLSRQVSDGKKFATAITEVAPHGLVKDGKNTTTIVQNLIDKTTQNLKSGQFVNRFTCLVLNLLLIDGYYNDPDSLRPIAFGWPDDWSVRSGPYWNLAFGEPEHLVFGLAEFEGKPGIEGVLGRKGVLAENSNIAALLLVVHPLGGARKIYGLKRDADNDTWQEDGEKLATAFFKLVGTNWNDELDTNGWCLYQNARGEKC